MKFCLKNKKGFTLIELLVVIGILAILLSIVLIAINPGRQFAQANNTKRRSDTTAILNAISQYGADHHGVVPAGITDAVLDIGSAGANICGDIMPTYISALPVDPETNNGIPVTSCATAYTTGYSVVKDVDNRITVSAPLAKLNETIAITR
jgi:prepilin-type N-terminal cleavage/methylation domain-containing protein